MLSKCYAAVMIMFPSEISTLASSLLRQTSVISLYFQENIRDIGILTKNRQIIAFLKQALSPSIRKCKEQRKVY